MCSFPCPSFLWNPGKLFLLRRVCSEVWGMFKVGKDRAIYWAPAVYRGSATAFSKQPSKVGTTIITIFQIQKLRLREVKESAHGSMMPWCFTSWCFSMAFLNLAQPTLVEGYFLMWRAILCIVGCLASLASFHYSWPLGTILSQNKNSKITPLIARYPLGTNHPDWAPLHDIPSTWTPLAPCQPGGPLFLP